MNPNSRRIFHLSSTCKLGLIALFLCANLHLTAQDKTSIHQYDSVMHMMKNKSIPFMDRYYMTGDIDQFAPEQIGNILKALLPEARKQEDKAIRVRLYSLIAFQYINDSQLSKAQIYLDSAFVYRGTFENDNIAGLMYNTRGRLYENQYKIKEALQDYYKAAGYFNKRDPKPPILSDIYYNISVIDGLKKDEEGLKQVMDWMHDIPIVFPHQLILKNAVKAQYFNALFGKTNNVAFLDSISTYNQQVFDAWDAHPDFVSIGTQLSENYIMQAEVYLWKQNLKQAKYCLARANELMNPRYLPGKIASQLVSAKILFYEKQYAAAEKTLTQGVLAAEELTKEEIYMYYLGDYYGLLAKVYEKQDLYVKALDAERQSLKYTQALFDSDNNAVVQNLKSKYDLDNKQRLVEQLTKINEVSTQNSHLLLGFVGLLVVVFVLVLWRALLARKLHLKKKQIAEQEYQNLKSTSELKELNSYLAGLESERLRISKDLHDNIANSLLAVNMHLLAKEDSDMAELPTTLLAIYTQVRNISHSLIPPLFEYASLEEVLEEFVYQQNLVGNAAVAIHIDAELDRNKLTEEISLEIYRIIQEAVANAMKYAEASKIEIKLASMSNHLLLSIADDGKGFDTTQKRLGIGLRILEGRAKSIGGAFAIRTAANEGTDIVVNIPLF